MLPVMRNRLPSLGRNVIKLSNIQVRNYLGVSSCIQVEQKKSPTYNLNLMIQRYKSKKKSIDKREESDSEEEIIEKDELEGVDRNSKVITVKLNSLRMDNVLKIGLGIARNKVSTLFYESRIRVNGEKVQKKSFQVNVGDEIDIIKGVHMNNTAFLIIGRVEILDAAESEDSIKVKLRRNKSLMIENYSDPWKGGPATP